MIVLGLDFGMKYIGIAVGQSVTRTATPLTSIMATDGVPKWDDIQKLINEWKPSALILGIPLNMDGTEQPITFAARRFGDKLKNHFKLPLHLVDERLSTWEAKERIKERTLQEKGNSRSPGKPKQDFKLVNAMAAAILVEQWLSSASL